MEEDNKLLNRFGRKNPYSLPEGYFEQFTKQIMRHLPEENAAIQTVRHAAKHTPTPWQRFRPWIYMAAMFAGIAFMAHLFINGHTDVIGKQPVQSVADMPEEYLEPIMDQTMMDDYELYEYITEAYISETNE